MSANSIRFTAVGDISLGDHPLCAGIGTHSKLKNKPALFPFTKVKPEFDKADILFGNLECTLSNQGENTRDYHSIQMRGHPAYIDSLTEAGFDVLNMANNHAMQHGEEPFKETVNILTQHDIKPCGVNYENHQVGIPVIIDRNGLRVAFLGYSLRPRQYFEQPPLYTEGTAEGIIRDVQSIKDSVDHVIVSLHWGDEFIDYPSPDEVRLARQTIDAGASLIVGHHPHVLRGIEPYKNGYIVYSMGNFICDMVWDPSLRETMIFSCTFSKTAIENPEYIPVWINNDSQAEILQGKAADNIRKKITQLSKKLTENDLSDFAQQQSSYQTDADEILRVIRKKSQRFFLSRLWNYPKLILLQQLSTYFKNRYHEFKEPQH